jgi:hypothetical protein
MIMALSKRKLRGKNIINVLFSMFKSKKEWRHIEYFDERWKGRIKAMAAYINNNESVVDLGCGQMWLEEYLPAGCTYIPVDYKSREGFTIIADFNKHQYPPIDSDVAFISGCLEYIKDYKWFIEKTTSFSKTIILSYCTTDSFPDMEERKNLFWVNHLSSDDIKALFNLQNAFLRFSKILSDGTNIFVFAK